MRKIILLFVVIILCNGCKKHEKINNHIPDEAIVLNNMRKLETGEKFVVVKANEFVDNENDYRTTVLITNGIDTEEYLILKDVYSLYLFENYTRILIYFSTVIWSDNTKMNLPDYREYGYPLYYINGVDNTSEYITSTFPGFFVLENEMAIINTDYSNFNTNIVSPNIYAFSIEEKRVLSFISTDDFVRSKTNVSKPGSFFIAFGAEYNRAPVINGYNRMYFDHWGEDGPESFYAYLDLNDLNNLRILENMPYPLN